MLCLMMVLTVVSATVDETQSGDLVAAFEDLLATGLPDGLLETRLVAGDQQQWAIHSLWRGQAALEAMRASGEPPAAPALFKRFGAEPSLAILRVMANGKA